MEGTLFVAATRSMGIGLQGRVPWKKQMSSENAYFHRVSTYAPPGSMNAIIMGRGSWDSLSKKPMANRINVIVTRDPVTFKRKLHDGDVHMSHVHIACNLDEAYDLLYQLYSGNGGMSYRSTANQKRPKLGRVFLTGGAFAGPVLADGRTKRFLLSVIEQDFECDTYVPVLFTKGGAEGWHRCSASAHERWVGERVQSGIKCENGIEYECMMFERED